MWNQLFAQMARRAADGPANTAPIDAIRSHLRSESLSWHDAMALEVLLKQAAQ
jgi:hypothetical protein